MNESSTNKKLKTILILAAILVMPGFLYYLLQDQGKNRYKPLPFYGTKVVASTFHSVRGKKVPDTVYHRVSGFSFSNQQGKIVTSNSWEGKVVIVNLFYTEANSLGAKSAQKAMHNFSELYAKNHMVHLSSISVDDRDDISRLQNFAKRINAKQEKWDFLTGDSLSVNKFIKESLLLSLVKETVNGECKFIYSNKFVLLDSKARIRGFYEAANKEDLSKLDDEIKVLIAEELRNIKDGR